MRQPLSRASCARFDRPAPDEVVEWRFDELERAGLDALDAIRLALEPGVRHRGAPVARRPRVRGGARRAHSALITRVQPARSARPGPVWCLLPTARRAGEARDGRFSICGFRAGVGRVDATPPLTAPHASWGAQVHVLPDGVEAPLWASALVVDDGTTMAAWIDLDVVIITRAESDAIREAVGAALGIPASHVRASVTHNHAGPPPSVWNWTNQGQAALDGYFAMLPEYAAGAARAALGSMRPARVGAGSGESRVAMNRRETGPRREDGDGLQPVTG